MTNLECKTKLVITSKPARIIQIVKFRIKQKQLIIVHIALFAISFAFLEYSKMFRMNKELHWIYSLGHNWWLMIAFPCLFWGSLILGGYSLCKVNKNKFLYFIFGILPLAIFLIFTFFT
ncbi:MULTISPECIES: hypothetical protein [Chryseobacterium]|uniref:hypothetical protein n=1 Tax=Chryseobacterium TaxID=59732 RepID=UPI001629EC06|nr:MULTISPECIES: hypothetical protein [Chryseobacterium]MDM1555473.1 hypothetical protein [Chryseobacterium indologenes]